MLRHIADDRHLAGRENPVAVVERDDHQMMQVGGENQRDAHDGEKIADQRALLVLSRIDGGDEAKPHLLGNNRAGDLQGRNRQPRRHTKHCPDHDLLKQHQDHRHEGIQIDLIGRLMRRQQDAGQNQRDRQPHA